MKSAKPSANWVFDAATAMGVGTVVFSPGSRNAPLIIAATGRDDIKVRTVLDERSAGFQALGESLLTGKPVALCCTSGSAVANYYPAVLEAYYSKVPLVIISADRPSNRVNKGEGQTCVQPGIFEPHVGWSVHLNEDMPKELVTSELEKAAKILALKKEPVHINIAFDEPLYVQIAEADPLELNLNYDTELSELAIPPVLEKIFNHAGKVALMVGQLTPQQAQALGPVLSSLKVPYFADPTSNLRFAQGAMPMEAVCAYKPQAVLSIGGQWVDKRPKQYLREISLDLHVHVDPNQAWEVLDLPIIRWNIPPQGFELLKERVNGFCGESERWLKSRVDLPWSDARAFELVVASIDKGDVVHLGNSSTVRYANWFPIKGDIYCNRGVAGIDGSFSTAVGAALSTPERHHWLIIGDQSLQYDSNALVIQARPNNLTVVVLNNARGGIFDWLPGTAQTNADAKNVFNNPLIANFKALSEAWGIGYSLAGNEEELQKCLEVRNSGLTLIDVQTSVGLNLSAFETLKGN
jgi:2-succinyl-5-enolpyruvyl-6-hydroxy-3-cyclohexene-1-carboxylate synthase